MASAAESASALGHTFGDPALLREALTHRSAGAPHNERLEFLGDAVLGCVIAHTLHARLPAAAEGELSRARARLVNQASLVARAEAEGIGARLVLGDGERRSGGRSRPSILADAFEAVIGAIWIDGGFDAARDAVSRSFAAALDALATQPDTKDAKTALQEWLQGRRRALPIYRLLSAAEATGAASGLPIRVECAIAEPPWQAVGEGSSRRIAEQAAAGALLARLEGRGP